MSPASLQIVRTVSDLRHIVTSWRKAGLTVAVVPTMGALHEAHLELARSAKSKADRTIVTIFVNPDQFNDKSDLANYPRTEKADSDLLRSEKVDVLYAPSAEEMYPPGFSTKISVPGLSAGLCGDFRPGHFDGVATIVAKLLNQTQADIALFGEKDFQQLQIIRQLALDLNVPTTIIAHPTVRESDGLAMSSRNARLTAAERLIAPALSMQLHRAATRIEAGEPAATVITQTSVALTASGFSSVEYLELRAEDQLAPLHTLDKPARLLAAAILGKVRLIDNVPVVTNKKGGSA